MVNVQPMPIISDTVKQKIILYFKRKAELFRKCVNPLVFCYFNIEKKTGIHDLLYNYS